MKKVSELEGAELDYLVAKADDLPNPEIVGEVCRIARHKSRNFGNNEYHWAGGHVFRPSTDWSQGGPLIERECLDVWFVDAGVWRSAPAHAPSGKPFDGTTPLIAAMRAFVASKFGDEVECR